MVRGTAPDRCNVLCFMSLTLEVRESKRPQSASEILIPTIRPRTVPRLPFLPHFHTVIHSFTHSLVHLFIGSLHLKRGPWCTWEMASFLAWHNLSGLRNPPPLHFLSWAERCIAELLEGMGSPLAVDFREAGWVQPLALGLNLNGNMSVVSSPMNSHCE